MRQLFLGPTIAVLLFVGGYVSAVPFFDLEDEIETFGPLARTDGNLDAPDLDEVVISGSNDGSPGNAYFPPIFPPFNNPFFTNPMFSSFGNIDFGFGNAVPWWKGQNVCVDRVEEEESDVDDDAKATTEVFVKPQPIFGGLQFSVNSCVEKPHKHTCKKIYSQNGEKKTLTITRQCCHGFGRPPNSEYTEQCQKIEVKTFEEAANDMGGNEFLRSVKNNGLESMFNSNLTLFLPTNDAFTKFSEQMFENNLVYVPMGGKRLRRATDQFGFSSKDLLKSHMVNGLKTMDDLANEDILHTKLDNSTIRINIYNRPLSKKGALFTANCAPLLKVDQVVTDGIMHTVSRVLSPVTENVMDLIRQRSDMAVFKTVLEKTKLSELLEGTKPVTVFAPTDKAFEKLEMNMRRKLKEGKGCAANILKNHLLDFTFCSEAAVANSKPVAYNILGEGLRFERSSNDEPKTSFTIDDILINGLARIVESDIMGTNGVLHVVDVILPSDSSRSVSSLMQEKNLSIFKSLLEASGLEAEFNDYENATILAPIDKSFEDSQWVKMLEQNPELLKNSQELKDYLRGHVIQPKIKTCDLKEDVIKSVSGSDLRINLYSTHSIFTNVMNRATVNCARLVHFDDESCGTVLHQVERQLENPQDNLFKIMESNPQYSKFLEAVKLANLTDLLNDNNDSYTVFLPSNEVFREFNIDVSKNQTEAEHFVKDHIVNDVVCCAGITPTNWPLVRTIEAVSGTNLRINRDRRPKVENAIITKCDVLATNGLVHEINDVIITKPKQPPTFTLPDQSKYEILRDVFF